MSGIDLKAVFKSRKQSETHIISSKNSSKTIKVVGIDGEKKGRYESQDFVNTNSSYKQEKVEKAVASASLNFNKSNLVKVKQADQNKNKVYLLVSEDRRDKNKDNNILYIENSYNNEKDVGFTNTNTNLNFKSKKQVITTNSTYEKDSQIIQGNSGTQLNQLSQINQFSQVNQASPVIQKLPDNNISNQSNIKPFKTIKEQSFTIKSQLNQFSQSVIPSQLNIQNNQNVSNNQNCKFLILVLKTIKIFKTYIDKQKEYLTSEINKKNEDIRKLKENFMNITAEKISLLTENSKLKKMLLETIQNLNKLEMKKVEEDKHLIVRFLN